MLLRLDRFEPFTKYDRTLEGIQWRIRPTKIVDRAGYWCSIMDERLAKINGVIRTYPKLEDMPDIALFFDELGNLNASLESFDKG